MKILFVIARFKLRMAYQIILLRTTFCPNMTKITAADQMVGGWFYLSLAHFGFQEPFLIHIKTESAILVNFIMTHTHFLHNPKRRQIIFCTTA